MARKRSRSIIMPLGVIVCSLHDWSMPAVLIGGEVSDAELGITHVIATG